MFTIISKTYETTPKPTSPMVRGANNLPTHSLAAGSKAHSHKHRHRSNSQRQPRTALRAGRGMRARCACIRHGRDHQLCCRTKTKWPRVRHNASQASAVLRRSGFPDSESVAAGSTVFRSATGMVVRGASASSRSNRKSSSNIMKSVSCSQQDICMNGTATSC